MIVASAFGATGLLLPDLVADPPEEVALERIDDNGKSHLLVRFDGFIHNRGPGPLEVRGTDRQGSSMRAKQWAATASGELRPVEPPSGIPLSLVYERSDGHNHWHLKNAARYALWNADRTRAVAVAGKVGFCLQDSEPAPGAGRTDPRYTNGTNNFCHQGRPDVPRITEGVSPGWRDVYARNLPFQWVNASAVAPGTYWLGAEVDPAHSLVEADSRNPTGFAPDPVVIDGYTATDQRSIDLVTDAPSPVLLEALVSGTPGPRAFRIVSGPTHGRLDVAVGTALERPVLTYSPNVKFRGIDQFTYVAFDSTSPFPTRPVIATYTLEVGPTPAGLIVDPPPSPRPVVSNVPLLGVPLVQRSGSLIKTRVTPGRSGLVSLRATLGKQVVGGCRLRTGAGRPATCKVRLKQGANARDISINIRLSYGGRVIAERVVRPIERVKVVRGRR